MAGDVGGWSGEEEEKVAVQEFRELSIPGVGWDIHVETKVPRARSVWT